MPLTATGNSATVLLLYEALNGTNPPASAYYTQRNVLDGGGSSVASYANNLTDFAFRTASDATLANVVLDHLLGTDPANTATLHAAVTGLLAANPTNRGVVVLQLATLLSGKEGDPVYGAAAATWNARLNADLKVQLADPGPRFYSLTPGTDDITGTPAGDSFDAVHTSLNFGDHIAGGAGGDTLSIFAYGPNPVLLHGFAATSVETVTVNSSANGGTTVNLAGAPDATTLVNYSSGSDVHFTNLSHRVDLILANVYGGNTSVAFAPEVVQGSADVLDVALTGNQGITIDPAGGLYAYGIEVINLNTSGGASRSSPLGNGSLGVPLLGGQPSRLTEVAAPGTLAVLNISGDQDLRVDKVDFYGAGNTGVVNAATLTGKLTLGLGTQGGADASVQMQGGANVDTLRLGGPLAGYALTLASGKNVTSHLHNLQASSAQSGNVDVASVERLRFSDVSLAIDLRADQAGGKAAELLGAVLGLAGLADKASAGWLLGQFDNGVTLLGATQQLLNNGFLAAKAGGADAASIVSHVYANVMGQAPQPATLAALLAPITNHSTTLAQWVADMAASSDNQAHVQLSGYLQTGLAYA